MSYSSLSVEELIRICTGSGEAAAWEEFVRRFHRLIAGVVLRSARRWGEASPHLVDELVQETYLKLCTDDCRMLRDFQPRQPDSIYGYLKVVAANVVYDHFRAARSAKRRSPQQSETAADPAAPSGSEGSPAAVERRVLLEEIAGFLEEHKSVGERERLIFWLYYRQGLTARAIAALPAIELSVKGVESSLFRLTRLVRTQLVERRSAPGRSEVNAPEGIGGKETF
jgi:RNA polymerase sigma-70 factor (ECF subfamily)